MKILPLKNLNVLVWQDLYMLIGSDKVANVFMVLIRCVPSLCSRMALTIGSRVDTLCSVSVFQNGTDYGFLVRQNSELLRSLDEMEKTCNHLREENGLLVKHC